MNIKMANTTIIVQKLPFLVPTIKTFSNFCLKIKANEKKPKANHFYLELAL